MYILLGALAIASTLLALTVSSAGAGGSPSKLYASIAYDGKGYHQHWIGYGATKRQAEQVATTKCLNNPKAACWLAGWVKNGWISFTREKSFNQKHLAWGWGWGSTSQRADYHATRYCEKHATLSIKEPCVAPTHYQTSRVAGQTKGPGGTQGAPQTGMGGNILSPFDESETWYVCRGYNTKTHSGNSAYALDFILDKPDTVGSLGCTSQNVNASSGEPVHAPVPGHTSACWPSNTQFVCVQSSAPNSKGYYFIIGHVDPDSRLLNTDVQAGSEVIGRLAPAGSGGLEIAHLHIEARPEGPINKKSVPFTSANGIGICQQDFPSDGSANQHSGKALHGC
jgi:hypothetical protein